MEFFDFTGTNDEEKTQVLNILSPQESSGVEFFSIYNQNSLNQELFLMRNIHSSPNSRIDNSYQHVNGELESGSQNNCDTLSNHSSPNLDVNRPYGLHQANNYNSNNNNWEIISGNSSSNSTMLISNSNLVIQQPPNSSHAPSTPVVCAAPSLYSLFPAGPPPGPAYFAATPHPNPYSIHALHPPTMHQVHSAVPSAQLPSTRKDFNKSLGASSILPPNAVSSSHLTSTSKTFSINSNNATSTCDNRNFYMPPSQYSEALETNHLKTVGDRELITNSDQTQTIGQIANESSGGLGIHPHSHHLNASQTYPGYAFAPPPPQTHALFSHHGPFTQPIYYFHHSENGGGAFIPTYFPPSLAPHIQPQLSAAPAHNSSILDSSIEISQSNLAKPQKQSSPQSSTVEAVAMSPVTISAVSDTVEPSILNTYHQNSTFEENVQQNSNFVCPNQTSNFSLKSDSQATVALSQSIPNASSNHQNLSKSNLTSKSNSVQVDKKKPTLFEKNEILTTPTSQNVQQLIKHFHINEDSGDEHLEIENDSQLIAQTINESSIDDMSSSSKNEEKLREIVKNDAANVNQSNASTWASKLFGSTQINNVLNKLNASDDSKQQPQAAEHNNEPKQNLTNGDFPELKNNINSSNSHQFNRNKNYRNYHLDNDSNKLEIIAIEEDPIALRLAKRFRDTIHLKHSLPTIMPCGLVNRGNWCYVNAVLQALLACPPFYNLMREISETSGLFRRSTSTPIIDNFARYFSKFLPTDYKKQIKDIGKSYLEEILNSEPIEPTSIYDTLKHIGMIKNDAQRGHQEDAEEFLSSVLNGFHEEMIKLLNFLAQYENQEIKLNGQLNKSSNDSQEADKEDCSDSNDNLWREVGTSKHKSLPTRSAKVISTLITEIFGGSTLGIITVNKDKDASGSRQPFFTLQLDIKPSMIKTLEDAIRWQTRSEIIHGYQCSKSKQIVEASSQMFFENLPPILIFHLKLFDYDAETGAGRKLLKVIEFTENIEIPRECVTGKGDIAKDRRMRFYKLLGVVYHNGSESINGHYITDVYHLGLNQWLRCDDASIKVISLSKVLTSGEREGNLVPYMLFYRRFDTLHNSSNSQSSLNSANTGGVSSSNASNSYHGTTLTTNNKRSSNISNSNFFTNSNNDYHYQTNHDHHHHQQQQHTDIMVNISNKFSSISRY